MEDFMAILAECPFCHTKQSAKNKVCKCGADLVKAKRAKKLKYWINFRMPNGKQRRQAVGYSIQEARDADGKRRSQKREHRIFDMLPESNMTFNELTEWYLDLRTVKKLAAHDRIKFALNNFNKVFGDQIVGTIIPVNLENYQEKRLEQGMAPATVDLEISIAKTMITKAFDNDMVDGRVLRAFRSVKRKLKKGRNARKRTLTFLEYIRLHKAAAAHLKPILEVAYNTGMRLGELRELKWSYIDRKAGFIRLPAAVTKEKKSKKIPINRNVWKVLKNIPRAINHDFVFTYKGNPIRSKSGLNHSFQTACKQAGIPFGRKTQDGITFHDIRRTVKTNMLNAGVDKAHRDLILGHSLLGMDSFYLAPDEKSLKKAMEKYTKWLNEQIAQALPSVDHFVDQDVKKD
jgi:integrase